jgi:hypothetical protein
VGGVGREDSDERDEEDDAGAELFADEDRRLCPDGACIGLIGYDGRCKVCGRSADDVGPE